MVLTVNKELITPKIRNVNIGLARNKKERRDRMRKYEMSEVRAHNTARDCWLVIHGLVYDLTEFLNSHPGGSAILLSCAGKDATLPYSDIHPKDLAQKMLPTRMVLGEINPKTITEADIAPSMRTESTEFRRPPLNQMINAFDFENVAKHVMSTEGWGYYSSAAEDEITARENRAVFQRVWLRPRVLVNVKDISIDTRILGLHASFPLYITATALGKLADPEGELAIVRAAAKCKIPYMLPTLSSYSLDEMLEVRDKSQVLWSQIYVNADREVTFKYIQHLEQNGVKALFITVDAPQLGRREKDMRNKFQKEGAHIQEDDNIDRSQGVAKAISGFIDHTLDWAALKEIMQRTKLPVYLKGVQTGEDALLAYQVGVAGIIISNHGGRQLDVCRSALEILPEVMSTLRSIPTYSKEAFPVLIDGGIRRGSDIYKALALGASAVGIGRPVLYALAGYGQKGVEHLIENVFKPEFENTMQLMGATSVSEIKESSVITKNLSDHISTVPKDSLTKDVYEPLKAVTLSKL